MSCGERQTPINANRIRVFYRHLNKKIKQNNQSFSKINERSVRRGQNEQKKDNWMRVQRREAKNHFGKHTTFIPYLCNTLFLWCYFAHPQSSPFIFPMEKLRFDATTEIVLKVPSPPPPPTPSLSLCMPFRLVLQSISLFPKTTNSERKLLFVSFFLFYFKYFSSNEWRITQTTFRADSRAPVVFHYW